MGKALPSRTLRTAVVYSADLFSAIAKSSAVLLPTHGCGAACGTLAARRATAPIVASCQLR
jgi:hypothetical protein